MEFVSIMLDFSCLLILYLTKQSHDLSDIKIDRLNCTILMIDLLGVRVYWWEHMLEMFSYGINWFKFSKINI